MIVLSSWRVVGARVVLGGMIYLSGSTILAATNGSVRIPAGALPAKPIEERKEVGTLKADLLVTRFVITSQTASRVYWECTIKNVGKVPVPLSKIYVQAYQGATPPANVMAAIRGSPLCGGLLDPDPTGRLKPGDEYSTRVVCDIGFKSDFAWLVVDKDNLIDEMDEQKNFMLEGGQPPMPKSNQAKTGKLKAPTGSVLTDAQVNAFVESGDPSVMGRVVERKIGRNYVLTYIDKGATKVIISKIGNNVVLGEFKGDLDALVDRALTVANKKGGETMDPGDDYCLRRCNQYVDWLAANDFCSEEGCDIDWIDCLQTCDENTKPMIRHSYQMPKAKVDLLRN